MLQRRKDKRQSTQQQVAVINPEPTTYYAEEDIDIVDQNTAYYYGNDEEAETATPTYYSDDVEDEVDGENYTDQVGDEAEDNQLYADGEEEGYFDEEGYPIGEVAEFSEEASENGYYQEQLDEGDEEEPEPSNLPNPNFTAFVNAYAQQLGLSEGDIERVEFEEIPDEKIPTEPDGKPVDIMPYIKRSAAKAQPLVITNDYAKEFAGVLNPDNNTPATANANSNSSNKAKAADTKKNDEAKYKIPLENLFNVQEVAGALINAGNGNISSLLQMRGLESRLLSQSEKASRVEGIRQVLAVQNSKLSFCGRMRPYNATAYLDFLYKRLNNEKKSEIRQLLVVLIKYFEKLEREKTLTARTYFMTLAATSDDISRLSPQSLNPNAVADNGGIDGDGSNAKLKKFAREWLEAAPIYGSFAKKRHHLKGQNKSDEGDQIGGNSSNAFVSSISPAIKEHLEFKLQSIAANLESTADIQCRVPESDADTLLWLSGSFAFSGTDITTQAQQASATRNSSTSRQQTPNKANHPDTDTDPRRKLIEALYGSNGTTFEEHPDYIKLGDEYIRGYYVDEFPADVRYGVKRDVFIYKDMNLDYALHVTPEPNDKADAKLKSKAQWLETAEIMQAGKETDPARVRELKSSRYMRDELADGTLRIFMVGLRFALRARSLDKLKEDERRLENALRDRGFHLTLAKHEQLEAFLSAQPIGRDYLGENPLTRDRVLRNMRAETIACLMPNCIADELDPNMINGIPLGINEIEGRIVWFQRWGQFNANTSRGGTSGSGKTVGAEWEVILELLHDQFVRCFGLDPSQGAMTKLAELVGGRVINLGASSDFIFNCVDRYIIGGEPETIANQANNLHKFFETLLDQKIVSEETPLTKAIKTMYHHMEQGVTARPAIIQALQQLAPGKLNLYAVAQELDLIYRYFTTTYNLLPTGYVAGNFVEPDLGYVPGGFMSRRASDNNNIGSGVGGGNSEVNPFFTKKLRPIVKYDPKSSRYIYAGGGLTSDPLPEDAFTKNNVGIGPARVYYPDKDWYAHLRAHFQFVVEERHIFDALHSRDDELYKKALEIAFLELKSGMPIMSDLFPFMVEQGLGDLVKKLEVYADRDNYKIFNGYTSTEVLDNRLIVFNLYEIRKNQRLRPARAFQALQYIWGLVQARPMVRTLLEADEMEETFKNAPSIGSWCADMFLTGRGNGMSTDCIVQNLPAIVSSPWGREIIGNSERYVMMRHRDMLSAEVKQLFRLSNSQADYIRKAKPGNSLQQIGSNWYDVKYSIPVFVAEKLDTRPVKDADKANTNAVSSGGSGGGNEAVVA